MTDIAQGPKAAADTLSSPPVAARNVTIAPLATFDQLQETVAVQLKSQPYLNDKDIMNGYSLMDVVRSGGVVLGARNREGAVVGYTIAFLASDVETKELYWCRQSTGVLPEYQRQGIGQMLLEALGQEAAKQGNIAYSTGKFWPFNHKSAAFFLSSENSVQAVGRVLLHDYYGQGFNQLEHESRPGGRRISAPPTEQIQGVFKEPREGVGPVAAPTSLEKFVKVPVPKNFYDISETPLGKQWNEQVLAAMARLFQSGYVIVDFRPSTPFNHYIFAKGSGWAPAEPNWGDFSI